jgi:rhodanese-related sulfurtransferase
VASHIPGARNAAPRPSAPISEFVAEVERLVGGDKTKALVLYCNGPFCQASRRLSEQLLAAGFTNVRRYQLGIPVWRALGGVTEIELDGIVRIFNVDRTAVFLDGRTTEEFSAGSLPGARNIPVGTTKFEGHPLLRSEDFNTRIVVFGRDPGQARALAEAIVRVARHNVSYFPGTFDTLRTAIK